MTNSEACPVEVLMVDDDELDYELMQRQFEKLKIANNTHWARDGVEGLKFLRDWYARDDHPPIIVLLDINMPRMSGFEMLQEVRQDESLNPTVIFMLTTSDQNQDIIDAYNLNVAGYLVKGNLGTSFLEGIAMLESYWRVVELPRNKVLGSE